MKHTTPYLLAGLALVGIAGLLTYSTLVEPYRIEVVRHDMRKADASENLRVIQVSDLHLRDFGKHEEDLAEQIKALDADVVILTGDAIDREKAQPWLSAFIEALGHTPVLHVLGNWEHWSGLSEEALTRTGARLLLNEKWILQKGERRLEVIGLDDHTAGQPDLGLLDRNDASLSALTTVLVQHSPAFFGQASVHQRMGSARFDLCLAGHTHGGQVALLGWAPLKPPGSGDFTAGFYDVPGCRLYVSRGLGTSILPIRLGSVPELVVFDL